MRDNTTRPVTGFMVIVLALGALIEDALRRYNRAQEALEKDGRTADTLDTGGGLVWAATLTPRGWLALCSEGVGPERIITPSDPLQIPLYSRHRTETGTSISMNPVMMLSLAPDDLLHLTTGEQVPLEKFIRTFGDRLESNFNVWHRAISRAQAGEDPFPPEKPPVRVRRKRRATAKA